MPKPRNLLAAALVLAVLMCTVSAAGWAAKPRLKAARVGEVIVLEKAVPKSFAGWIALPQQTSMVVNPQAEEGIYGLYSQVLSRTYVDASGYRIMLSVAYNDDQRGGLQTHRPEVCYPAQGFTLGRAEDGELTTAFGELPVRRLTTSLGARNEPITYWLTVGSEVVKGRLYKRLAEMKMALTGQIPDGLLFRISSIDADPARAFEAHQRFASDMLGAVPAPVRKQLSGLSAKMSTT